MSQVLVSPGVVMNGWRFGWMWAVLWLTLGHATPLSALEMKITPTLEQVTVQHGGRPVQVMRNQDPNARLEGEFSLIARKCPPFCAQPMQVHPQVRTVGEVEVLQFMATELAQGTGLLVDSRTPDWHAKGTIPGSINVPYSDVARFLGADDIAIESAMERFGAKPERVGFDFSQAKTLLLWCNGPWCGQSPSAIRGLVELGYPPEKLLYYRGGMQMWQLFGLTVVPPAQ
ncbi:MAG: rhodanese-like domain-containing protein [Magnetococcus sp. WYHC-3]